jgi:hypothetical protein
MSFAFIEPDIRSAETHALMLSAQNFVNARILGLPAMVFKKIHANSFPSTNHPFHIKVNCGNERGVSHAFKAATDIFSNRLFIISDRWTSV